MKKLKVLSALVLVIDLALPAFGQATRYAVVVGNGNYIELGKLKNPVNDAHDLGEALRSLGFEVDSLADADLPTMEDAVLRLGNRLSISKDAIGFFFYAGHGVQSNGINYLIPTDAHIPAETFLRTKALSAQEVLDVLQEAHNSLNVVILDACRDNPFSWARSGTRGLSVVSAQPPGSIIVFATSVGSVALDGQGRNGVFTSELLKNLTTPSLDIREVFNRTGAAVQAATNGIQVPAIYSQFFGEALLADSVQKPAIVPENTSPTLPDSDIAIIKAGSLFDVRRLLSGGMKADARGKDGPVLVYAAAFNHDPQCHQTPSRGRGKSLGNREGRLDSTL